MPGVLVIGGGGFVGRAIVASLAASADFLPVTGARRSVAGGAFRFCDATERASVTQAASGMQAIVNAAAGSPADMRRATQTICQVAAGGGQQIIHLSSMAVYGAVHGVADERAALDSAGRPYAAAKIDCEAALARFVAAGGTATILRPGIVYGPGDQQWIGRLCRLLRAGRLGDLGAAGDGFCNLVHAADVGAAVLACLRRPGGIYNLASRDPPRWNDVFARLAPAIGAMPLRRIGARRLALERRAAIPLQLAKLATARTGLAPGWLPEPLPASLLALFAQQIRLDAARADKLGIPRTGDAAGLADAAAWFVAQPRA